MIGGRSVGLTVAAAGVLAMAGTAIALQPDPRRSICTQGDPAERVEAAFAMDHARDYRAHLPLMGRSPELEVDDAAYVVVFHGPVDLPAINVAPPAVDANGQFIGPTNIAQQPATGVVCVVVRGRPTFYTSVDTAGMTP